MSVVIARDGMVYIVVNNVNLTPEQAYDLASEIKYEANKAIRQIAAKIPVTDSTGRL